MPDPITDAELTAYLDGRDQANANTVDATLTAMTDWERGLVHDAAVQGYVRGVIAARAGDHVIPRDSAIIAEVIDACHVLPDAYPTINRLRRRRRRG